MHHIEKHLWLALFKVDVDASWRTRAAEEGMHV